MMQFIDIVEICMPGKRSITRQETSNIINSGVCHQSEGPGGPSLCFSEPLFAVDWRKDRRVSSWLRKKPSPTAWAMPS
jgi:hypothetical protein